MHHFPPALRAAARLVCAGWLLAAGDACSAAATGPAPDYFMRAWQVENGLPQNKVNAVVQTRDGYLWVATYSGLARFDGVRFTVYNEKNTPEMHNSRVTSLCEAADGVLWIGHENGEVTARVAGRFCAVPLAAAGDGGKVYQITTDENGEVWLLNEAGLLARVRDGRVLSPPAGTAPKLLSLARSAAGVIWVARDGRMSILEHGQLRAFQGTDGTNAYVQGVCGSQDGGVWVSDSGRVREWRDNRWVQDLGAAPWGNSPLTCMVQTRDGTLAAGTSREGFYLMFPGTDVKPLHLNRISGFQADWVISLLEDREGTLWMGTGGNGLISLRVNNVQIIAPPDRWRGRAVLSICPDRTGGVWVGTEGAGLYHRTDDGWSNYGFTNGIGNSYVWSVTEDAAGKLWVGTWGAGLFLRDGDRFNYAPGMENLKLPVPALLSARAGGLWVGTSAGLLHYGNGKTNWYAGDATNPLRDVRCIAENATGQVWFGMAGNGLACLENGRIRQFHRADGLSSEYIECLHFDRDGALWIGTFGGGLCRLKQGRFAVIDSPQGLPNSVIGDIEDDGHGYFWMSSHGGIIRASKTELNDCADGKIRAADCQVYGINDGLPTIECSEGLQPAGCKTPDGRLWFPTSKGLVVIRPDDVKVNPLPPPMALEDLLVDGEPVTNMAPPLRIPPGHNRLEFDYTGLSLVAPEKVRFKYRIEGLEKDWVEAGTKRAANYSFVPPGNYVFQVIACNNDGIWNETGISLAFALQPHFWQTWWFRALSGGLIAVVASGTVWFDTRRRMHRRLERLERQQAVERERARIAQDIHDDLGASLTRITMLSQAAGGGPQPPDAVASNLERIHGTARELTRSMDEIVWAVNPRHDTLESLASYFSRFAYDFLSVAGVRCRLDFPLQLPARPLTAEIRHNLFLAFKETLHNVVSHAAAAEARISLKLGGEKIVLTVTDDGRGFDADRPPADAPLKGDRISRGNGLANLRRRLAEIDGTCEIDSQPGRGTMVKFTVTLPPMEFGEVSGRPHVIKSNDDTPPAGGV